MVGGNEFSRLLTIPAVQAQLQLLSWQQWLPLLVAMKNNPTIPHGTKEQDMSEGQVRVLRRLARVGFGYDLTTADKEMLFQTAETISAWNQRTPPRVKELEWVSCRRNETDPSVAHTLHTCFVGLVEVGEVLDYDEGDVWVDDGMRGGYCEFKDPAAPDIIAAAQASVARRVHACLGGYDD